MSKEERLEGLKLMERAKKLHSEIDELKRRLDIVASEFAEKTCPFSVGDTVEIAGYSYRGKKGLVTHVAGKVSDWPGRPISWVVCGAVLKADGTAGSYSFSFDMWQWGDYKEHLKRMKQWEKEKGKPFPLRV
ncbi:hypothetical protein [Candidatus Magnetobacterium casense]|uniref:Uncharacterized protein n=1 Tax=Candidatus Magnetobacterium casense TaxID=1455061 RepID=A0ABS6S0N9_9BACT|nr:hypothetical protein [Candidatus Magnetobacterium casensis]MBV6342418.1 hypothetical protein [Candidatus Magnetobacterium casensis]